MVRDLYIQAGTNDLIVATHGRGIMIVDDITPMRSMTKSMISQDVFLFDNKPVVLTTGKLGGGGFPNTGGWTAPNAPSIPPIQYYLKERVSIGDVNLEVYDPAGKLVRTIPGTIRKGINKLTWDLKMKPPKVASGGTKIDYGAFVAPMVLPGDYTLKLKVGDKQYTKTLKLIHDPKNKDFTIADRQLQYKTAMQLYNLHERLAATVDSINLKQRMLRENVSKVKDTVSKKLLQDYIAKLEELRSTLLATKQKSIFADEKKLREEITDVYAAVAGQEAAPSNLQLQRAAQLQEKEAKAEESRVVLNRQFDCKIKDALAKEGLPTDSKPSKAF
jgi:hypothetical protein